MPPQPQGDAQPAPLSRRPAAASSPREPKKIHTIAIHPDQMGDAPPAASRRGSGARPAASTGRSASPSSSQTGRASRKSPPTRRRRANPAPPAAPRAPEPRAAAPVQRAAAPSGQCAAVAEPKCATPRRGRCAPRRLPRRLRLPHSHASGRRLCRPGILAAQRSRRAGGVPRAAGQISELSWVAGKLLIHKVESGRQGHFYRALVGPFASASEATELCNGLKAAGGQCLIQRN